MRPAMAAWHIGSRRRRGLRSGRQSTMDGRVFDKSKLPSRHVSVGPARAPHRSYYYAMGMTEEEILSRVYDDNLFQYPTQREIKSKCRACLKRVAQIKGMPRMMEALAEGLAADGRLAALIALMLQNRLVAEFMVGVVGEKYRTLDYSLTRKDMNLFLMRLAEQDENVAGWSEQTVKRIRGVLHRCLTETGYLDDMRTEKLNPVLLPMEMENELRENGLRAFLPAFNILD